MYILWLCLAVLLQQFAGLLLPGIKFPAEAAATSAAQDKIILDKHNALRRDVQPPARNMLKMEWNSQAAANAKRWAEKCFIQHSPLSERTVNGVGCGENLFMSTARLSWDQAIQSWYNENKNFKYGKGATYPGAVILHYTQLVWAKSYDLGCAMAYCPTATYKYFYVCQYCPAGNIVGSINTPYAMGPPCGDCPRACSNRLCTNPCKHNDKFSNCKSFVSHKNVGGLNG